MLSGDEATCVPKLIGVYVSFSVSVKSRSFTSSVRTNSTTWRRCFSFSTPSQGGIAEPGSPWVTDWKRSSNKGSSPLPVWRILNVPCVKSLGRGQSRSAPGPSPAPSVPWHQTHLRK